MRPRPQYGEYADIPPVVAVEPERAAPPEEPAATPPRRTNDILLTVMLLGIGVWDVIRGFPEFADLSALLQQVFEQLDVGEFTSIVAAGQMGVVINVGRVVLLLAAIVISLMLIARNRRAFWVPLAAGAAAIIFMGICVSIVMAGDPAFIAYQSGLVGK